MTAVLVWTLVVLAGERLRIRPAARRPDDVTDAPAGSAGSPGSSRSVNWHRHTRAALRRFRSECTVPTPEQVATWCDGLARALRGGSTLTSAIDDVEPPQQFREVVEAIRLALRRGSSLLEACGVEACPAHLDLALTVIRSCAAHGGPAAEPLDRTAATLRGRAADQADRHTQSAQARLSATVMTTLPLCMLGLLLLTSGPVRGFVGSPPGIVAVAVGAALNGAGWKWMQRLIDGARR